MGQTMKINGTIEIITRPEDFGEMIEKYMGDEAAKYYRDETTKLVGALRKIGANSIDDYDLAMEVVDEYE